MEVQTIHITNAELSYEDCVKIFKSFIKQLKTMYMCGNPETIIARDTLEVFRYFRKHNPNMWLSMNTNAGAKDEAWWRELAQVFGRMGVHFTAWTVLGTLIICTGRMLYGTM